MSKDGSESKTPDRDNKDSKDSKDSKDDRDDAIRQEAGDGESKAARDRDAKGGVKAGERSESSEKATGKSDKAAASKPPGEPDDSPPAKSPTRSSARPGAGSSGKAATAGTGGLALDQKELRFEELAAMASRLSADDMIAALRDGRAVVKSNALRALATLNVASPQMIPLLRDSDPGVAHSAAEAVQRLGPALRPLISQLGDAVHGARPEVADIVLDTLAALVGEADDELIAALDVSPELGNSAIVEGLVRAGEAGAMLLGKALTREQTLIRFNSAQGLRRLARSGALDGFVLGTEIMQMLAQVRDTDTAPDVRSAAQSAILAIIGQAQQWAAANASAEARRAGQITIPHFDIRPLSMDELEEHLSEGDLHQMIHALNDGHHVVRANAARALATLGEKAAPAIRPMAVLLRDGMTSVRSAAATSLAPLGPGVVEVAEQLVAALGDRDPVVASQAQETIRKALDAATSDILPALVGGLKTSDRAHAMRIVTLLATTPDPVLILSDAFVKPDVNVQVNAALGFGLLGPERVGDGRKLLEGARTGGDFRTRAAVREALAMLAVPGDSGPPPITVEGFGERRLDDKKLAGLEPASLLAALRDGRSMARANAAAALGLLGPAVAEAARPLAVLTRDHEVEVRAEAVTALGKLGDGALAMADVLAAAAGDSEPAVHQAAREALATMGESARPALIRALETDSREHAIRLVGLIGALPEAVDRLCSAFASPAVNVQVNAALGLGLLGIERVGKGRAVLEGARTGGDARTRASVREALSMLEVPKPPGPPPITVPGFEEKPLASDDLDRSQLRIDSLVAALQDGRSVVRINAAMGLAVLGHDASSTARPVAVLLRDTVPPVRVSAARALGAFGAGALEVADALVDALGDRAHEVAEAAAETLASLGDDALPALLRGLEVDDQEHGERILGLITELPSAIDVLFAALENPSIAVQINAARGLGMAGARRVGERIVTLENAQWVGDLRTRRAVRSALQALQHGA